MVYAFTTAHVMQRNVYAQEDRVRLEVTQQKNAESGKLNLQDRPYLI